METSKFNRISPEILRMPFHYMNKHIELEQKNIRQIIFAPLSGLCIQYLREFILVK